MCRYYVLICNMPKRRNIVLFAFLATIPTVVLIVKGEKNYQQLTENFQILLPRYPLDPEYMKTRVLLKAFDYEAHGLLIGKLLFHLKDEYLSLYEGFDNGQPTVRIGVAYGILMGITSGIVRELLFIKKIYLFVRDNDLQTATFLGRKIYRFLSSNSSDMSEKTRASHRDIVTVMFPNSEIKGYCNSGTRYSGLPPRDLRFRKYIVRIA